MIIGTPTTSGSTGMRSLMIIRETSIANAETYLADCGPVDDANARDLRTQRGDRGVSNQRIRVGLRTSTIHVTVKLISLR